MHTERKTYNLSSCCDCFSTHVTCASLPCHARPAGGWTCAQQMGWGKCNDGWMTSGNFCRATCGVCKAVTVQSAAPTVATCGDNRPPGACTGGPFTACCSAQSRAAACRAWLGRSAALKHSAEPEQHMQRSDTCMVVGIDPHLGFGKYCTTATCMLSHRTCALNHRRLHVRSDQGAGPVLRPITLRQRLLCRVLQLLLRGH